MDAARPLSGLPAIEIGTSVAAPFAGQVLADLGTTLIKIENPKSGDDARNWGPPFVNGASPTFNAINRNKKSVAVDLKDETQREALVDFIQARVDIVIQNMRPGLIEAYGLDGATLCKAKPSLIYCNLRAYGSRGPLKNQPGYDPLMQAFGGLMSITGEDGREPVRTGPSIVDQGAGMWSVIGILAALQRRNATGQGCEIGTSLYETALSWGCMHISGYLGTGRVPGRIGSENLGIAPYKAYEASDGWLVIAAGNDNLFQRLATALDRADWASDQRFRSNPDRVKNRVVLNELIGSIVRTQPAQVWIEKLGAAGIPCAPMLTLDQVVAHPQFEAVGMLQQIGDGDMALVGLPLEFDGTRPAFTSHPPALGADNDILQPSKSEAASA